MRVPQALLDERSRMERVIDDEDAKIKLLQGSLSVTRARYEGLDTAIALIEGEEEREAYESVVVPPAEIEQAVPVPGPHAPGREPSGQSRAPRRNIKELVAAELRAVLDEGQTERGIASVIDVQLPQVKAALSKLAAEGKAAYSLATDRWHWGLPQGARKEPKPQDPALPEPHDPVSFDPKMSTESLLVYLTGRPEGRALTELCEVGYPEAAIRDAEVAGDIWLDARGFYHAAIRGPGENLEAAQ